MLVLRMDAYVGIKNWRPPMEGRDERVMQDDDWAVRPWPYKSAQPSHLKGIRSMNSTVRLAFLERREKCNA